MTAGKIGLLLKKKHFYRACVDKNAFKILFARKLFAFFDSTGRAGIYAGKAFGTAIGINDSIVVIADFDGASGATGFTSTATNTFITIHNRNGHLKTPKKT